jgi:heme-degrading monooxygenase HmoA
MTATTTLSLFRYRGFSNAFWAFSQMGLAPRRLKNVPGMSFHKLLGTGSAGFSTWPDWSVYGLLQVWDSADAATAFFDTHPQIQAFQKKAEESLRIFMHPVRSKGVWNGRNPFAPGDETLPATGVTAVLTRATIKKRYLRRFWSYVPRSQQPLSAAEGLIYSKGVGETPFIDMATFSLWESAEAMQAYAYGTEAHLGAIRRTRELGWYREELFARFRPYRIEGSWEGIPGLHTLKEMLRNRG